MARFTVSPNAISQLAQSFLGGAMVRENARQNALKTQLMQQQLDMGALQYNQREEQNLARQNALGNYLTTTLGLDRNTGLDAQDFLRGKRTKYDVVNGEALQVPIKLPEIFNNPQTMQQLGNIASHFALTDAYDPAGAANFQKGLGIANQNQMYNSAMAQAFNAKTIDDQNRAIALATNKTYTPMAQSGGVVYNTATGANNLTALGQADAQYKNYQAQTEQAKLAKVMNDIYVDNQKLALNQRVKGFDSNLNPLAQQLADNDPYFRDNNGNVTIGTTAHLPDKEIEHLFPATKVMTPDGSSRTVYPEYEQIYKEAHAQGFKSVADYLNAQQKAIFDKEKHAREVDANYEEKVIRQSGGLNNLINDAIAQNPNHQLSREVRDGNGILPKSVTKSSIPENKSTEENIRAIEAQIKQASGTHYNLRDLNQQQILYMMQQGWINPADTQFIADVIFPQQSLNPLTAFKDYQGY